MQQLSCQDMIDKENASSDKFLIMYQAKFGVFWSCYWNYDEFLITYQAEFDVQFVDMLAKHQSVSGLGKATFVQFLMIYQSEYNVQFLYP